MDRLTNTNKWKDEWFLGLHPFSKLIFVFLYDNCDDAGFYSVSAKFMETQLKINQKNIITSTKALEDKVIFSKNRKKVWIRNFLFYQNQLPLDINNTEHKKIKLVLEKNLSNFNDDEDMQFIIEKVETGKKKKTSTRKKFEKPTIEEFEEYGKEHAKEKGLTIKATWYNELYSYYESNGWKVGKNPMVDWQASIRKNIVKEDKPKNHNGTSGNGKIDKIRNANLSIKNVVVD